MITNQQKSEIVGQINAYIKRTGKSANEIARCLIGISGATISNMRNGKWQSISDEKWNLLANHILFSLPAETSLFKTVYSILSICQIQKQTKVFLAKAGSGKTFSCRHYANSNPEVYYVSCGQWSKKQFVDNLLNLFGENFEKLKISERVDILKSAITSKINPLLCIDEVDKLQNSALLFLIELYNYSYQFAGLFLCATEAFENRIVKNVKRQKAGFEELLSRFGGNFNKYIPYQEQEEKDLAAVCRLRGINDNDDIDNLIALSKNILHKYDLRILNNEINEYKIKKLINN